MKDKTIFETKRKLKGKTQIDVAIACAVSLTTYRMWEYGVAKPSEENMKKLNDVLGIKAD